LAEQERQLLLGAAASDAIPSIDGKAIVQWVDPQAFAGPPEDALANPAAPTQRPSTSASAKSAPKTWLKFK
jgi:hypothetical protein